MTRILAIGDPHFQTFHLHRAKEFMSKLDGWISTVPRYDAIVVLGDVLHDHERINSLALNLAVEWLVSLRRWCEEVYVLVGNHDLINNGQFLTTNHWMNALKNEIRVVDDVVETTINEIPVTLVPYVPVGRFREALDLRCPERWMKSRVIFAHQEFQGAHMGSCVSTEGDEWSSEFPPVISGHIHGKQSLASGIFYPGSAVPVSFAETSERIVCEIIFPGGPTSSFVIKEHCLGLSRLISKNIVSDEWDSMSFSAGDMNHEIKVKIDATPAELKRIKKTKKYKMLKDRNVKIVFHRSRSSVMAENERIRSVVRTEGPDFQSILENLVEGSGDAAVRTLFNDILSSSRQTT
jgi:DNA repair exonuclease SbcCD nuclease subunit